MVQSTSISITPANHADRHRHGGADPLTGEVRINSLIKTVDTQVFTGNYPATYTDLDLSAVVGAVESYVWLRFTNTDALANYWAIRAKGDTNEYVGDQIPAGLQFGGGVAGAIIILSCSTDSAGVIQVRELHANRDCTVDVISYTPIG